MDNSTLLVCAVVFAFGGIGCFTLAAAVNCIADAWSKRKYTTQDMRRETARALDRIDGII